jgi:hypothetical protein
MNTATFHRPVSFRLRIAAAVALLSLAGSSLTPLLHAIPNQIGAIGAIPFVNPAGMRLEDYANRKPMWQDDAVLKGEWEMWTDTTLDDSTIELLRLKNSAVVYGLDAMEVLLQRRDNQPLRFHVKFSTEGESVPGKTRDQLITNINAWTGGSLELKDSVGSLNHEHIAVKFDATRRNEVRIIFEPLGKS